MGENNVDGGRRDGYEGSSIGDGSEGNSGGEGGGDGGGDDDSVRRANDDQASDDSMSARVTETAIAVIMEEAMMTA